MHRESRWLIARLLSCALAFAGLASCVSDGGPNPPEFGSIAITTVTNGAEPDPDGYSISVDGEEIRPIPANATLTLANFTPGTYSVQLDGVADHCAAVDGTTKAVPVEPDAIVEVTFEFNCSSEPLPDSPTARLTITNQNNESVTEGGVLEVTVPAGGFTTFTFDASRSEAGAGSAITGYEWESNGSSIGTLQTFDLALDEGEHLITLKVTNGAGRSETASATIIVAE